MSTPAPTTPPDAFRAYGPRRGHAHWVRDGTFTAYCGMTRFEGWLGTGNQSEYEEAARRRVCKRCVARAEFRFGPAVKVPAQRQGGDT